MFQIINVIKTIFVLRAENVSEANNLMKDLEPTTAQEYILKGVVNAVLGQDNGSVGTIRFLFWL